ncbi:MAG: Flp family type IVb pilin [Candidatus Aquicultor sp.]|nr:Flp family type IVb pilin [Candidatus Aquicultor sp.]
MLAWFYGKLATYLREESGATAVEYGIMVALIAAVIIGTVVILGTKIQGAFQTIVSNLG